MRPLHVLLAEHDELRRQAIAELLRGGGHPVLCAEAGTVAASALTPPPGEAAPPFDLLVLDLALPGLDVATLRAALAPSAPSAPTAPDSLDAAERRQIALVLAHTRGNRRDAARLLGIARSTLLNKIRRYGIT